MRGQTLGDKRGFNTERVRNDEASATISKGMPVVLVMDGSEDGFAVVLPSTAGAAKTAAFLFGIAVDDIIAGAMGEVQTYGVCNRVRMALRTRANTSGGSSFSTHDTSPLGALLLVDTVNNAFSTVADTVAAASSVDQTLTRNPQNLGFLGQSLASSAGIATATGETRTVITENVKAFLRMM